MIRSIKLCSLLAVALGGAAGAANAQVSPAGTAPGQTAHYAVDGRALGARLPSDRSTRDYKCSASEQFNGFTWCQRASREGAVEATTSILHAKDGTIVYVSRHQQPAFRDAAAAERDIEKYTRSFGESPKIAKMPRRAGTADATLATWGAIELEPLDGDSVKLVAEGKSPKKGFLIDYLGNLARSAQEGLPIYRLLGGPGFAWVASFDARGRGTLRLVAIDASALPAGHVATAQPATAQPATAQPATAQPLSPPADGVAPLVDEPPAPVRQDEPAIVAGRDAEGTITQLQLELASVRQEKVELERARAQAEEGVRLAKTEAAIAREEMEQARNAANLASEEIDRLKQGVAAPSSSLDWSNAAAIAGGAAAILMLGVWLGARASRKRAARPASSDESERTESAAAVRAEDVAALPPPSEQMASVDQDGLVRELGRRLGLEEEAAPLPMEEHAAPLVAEEDAVPLVADLLPADDPKPASEPEAAAPPIAAASQPEEAAPPIAAAIPSHPVPADAGAKLDTAQ